MNITKNKVGIKLKLAIVMLLPLLTSCATYNSSFACGDAKGANCTSMDRVDRMIASGEIERFNEVGGKCRGRRCKRTDSSSSDVSLEVASDDSMPVYFTDIEKDR